MTIRCLEVSSFVTDNTSCTLQKNGQKVQECDATEAP